MLNYGNLNDVEFEYLCRDIMSRMLGVELERFASGRDGGVDLTENAHKKELVVQVKHYVRTDISGLISSLRREKIKIDQLRPKKYYICCSKELSVNNKEEIYQIFSDYMESTKNIITLIEIDDFLSEENNSDVLRKHYKLWLESTNILKDILNNDAFIDCEVLLSGIDNETKLFVETSAYCEAIACLDKNRVLVILGNPGVGKTMTSKMLVLRYAALGYTVRFTTDGMNLTNLKKSLSASPKSKEIIVLDDCFGQAYFNMKETQENELLFLIKYISMNPNKILIMNSRVTIYQEARERTHELVRSMDLNEYKTYIIDMEKITPLEKARIFYNHLYFSNLPTEYWGKIIENRNYRTIIKHKNYNPRIIEFVVAQAKYGKIYSDTYFDYIMSCLNNPEQIWKSEYERRIKNTDRALLTTIYSLTDTLVSLELVKCCYNNRLASMPGVDISLNNFEQSLLRLESGMVKVIDKNGVPMLSVYNPSVNDFLCSHLIENIPEREEIVRTAISVRQLKRLLTRQEADRKLNIIFSDHSILQFAFESESEKHNYIVWYCCTHRVFDEAYRVSFLYFLKNIMAVEIYEKQKIPSTEMISMIFSLEVRKFYRIENLLFEVEYLNNILDWFDLEELISFLNDISSAYEKERHLEFISIARQHLEAEIHAYCYDAPVDEYDVNINEIFDECRKENDVCDEWLVDEVMDMVEAQIKDTVRQEIYALISGLRQEILSEIDFCSILSECEINPSNLQSLIDSYFYPEDDNDNYHVDFSESEYFDDEIDILFNHQKISED